MAHVWMMNPIEIVFFPYQTLKLPEGVDVSGGHARYSYSVKYITSFAMYSCYWYMYITCCY